MRSLLLPTIFILFLSTLPMYRRIIDKTSLIALVPFHVPSFARLTLFQLVLFYPTCAYERLPSCSLFVTSQKFH
ncbi:hypothetical protein HDV64DRAFT_250806, partial [Trichoderma sp. TUCIM 5745]